jgi:secreted PhoX family phosphatase
MSLTRRSFLKTGAQGFGALGAVLASNVAIAAAARAGGADHFGPLQAPDGNGLKLPIGFTSRIVATSTQPIAGTGHVWHNAPDGGATFPAPNGGWVYVSNSELSGGTGGVGAIRFDENANVVDAYSILSGTHRNCAGGPTPWGTWLSCEEVPAGRVYECDPLSPGSQGTLVAGLGTWSHEAAAVDPVNGTVYLTEDTTGAGFYRYTPTLYPDLSAGTMEIAEILDPGGAGPIAPGQTRPLAWHSLLDSNPANGGVEDSLHIPASERATRLQIPESTGFAGGEGCWYDDGKVYFSSKLDNRIWEVDTVTNTIQILYDAATSATPNLTGVDNVFAPGNGDIYVAEDGGNMEIVALTPLGGVVPIAEVTGRVGSSPKPVSEITGPALSPDGSRLYFSSQRHPGETFEVSGPFNPAPSDVPTLGVMGQILLAGALLMAGRWQIRSDERDRPSPSLPALPRLGSGSRCSFRST